jgi:hypothetical protein
MKRIYDEDDDDDDVSDGIYFTYVMCADLKRIWNKWRERVPMMLVMLTMVTLGADSPIIPICA